MIVDIRKLREAIEEVAEIAREGHEANEELFVEIAAAYGLRPELLTRKFHEQFPDGVGDRIATRRDNIRRLVGAMAEDERRFWEEPSDIRIVDFLDHRGRRYTGYYSQSLRVSGEYSYKGIRHRDGMLVEGFNEDQIVLIPD